MAGLVDPELELEVDEPEEPDDDPAASFFGELSPEDELSEPLLVDASEPEPEPELDDDDDPLVRLSVL